MFLLRIFNFWFLKISGPLAKAIVILDADNRITFATRIAGAILGGFYRDEAPSTALREPMKTRSGGLCRTAERSRSILLFFLFDDGPFDVAQGSYEDCAQGAGRGDHRGRRISWGCFAK